MKLLKKFLGGIAVTLGVSTVFATNYIWTSFFKVGSPITLPATQFVSGGVTSGNYTSGGQLLFQIGQSGANYSMLPLLDANGVAYSTGVDINYRTNIGSNIYNNNTGNVGIGTATPTKTLDVSGAAVISNKLAIGTTNPYSAVITKLHTNYDGANYNFNVFTQYSTDGTNYPWVTIGKGRGTQNSPLVVQNGDILGKVAFLGQYSTTPNEIATAAFMQAVSKGTFGAGIYPADLQFATTPIGAGTALVRMSILENGNIGIGTTTPVTQFEVYGPTAGISLTRIGDEPFIRLSDAGHVNGGQIRGLASTLGLRITNASAGTEWMRINASGYVGIGTAAPTATLEVLPANESATAGIKVRRGGANQQGLLINNIGGESIIGNFNTASAGFPSLVIRNSNNAPTTVTNAYFGQVNIAFGRNITSTTTFAGADMIIKGGNVGIATTAPTATLQVSGTTLFGNALGSVSQTDGFTTRAGSGLAWNDIQNLQLRDTDVANDKPTLTVISGTAIKARCFADGAQTKIIYGSVEIPHNMYTGTGAVLSPHVHWLPTTTATQTGVWFIDYSILKANGDYTSTTTISGTYYNLTGWSSRLEDVNGDISATGLALGDSIVFRIYRDPTNAADTYGGDMCLVQIGFHAQFDTLGSRQEYVK